jgi:hypothetical protein
MMLCLASVLLLLLFTYQSVAQAADASSIIPRDESKLQLCRLLFETNIGPYYMGMRLDNDNLRLDRHTSEHPTSGRTFQGNTSKTGIDVLGDRGTGVPSRLCS